MQSNALDTWTYGVQYSVYVFEAVLDYEEASNVYNHTIG
jgi:hypothetical protein